MGLTAGVAIVSAAEAAQISHEALLTNLDDSSDTNATIANALSEATNQLIRWVRYKGVDPSLVDSGTVTDLKAAATFYALYTVFSSLEQDEHNSKRASDYKKRYDDQLALVVLRTTVAGQIEVSPRGTPIVRNINSTWLIGGRDTSVPGGPPDQTWPTKL